MCRHRGKARRENRLTESNSSSSNHTSKGQERAGELGKVKREVKRAEKDWCPNLSCSPRPLRVLRQKHSLARPVTSALRKENCPSDDSCVEGVVQCS